MSQVHNIRMFRYTHPLATFVYLVCAQLGMIRVGVAGRKGPQRGRRPLPTTVKAILPRTYRSKLFHTAVGYDGTGNEPCHRDPSRRISEQRKKTKRHFP